LFSRNKRGVLRMSLRLSPPVYGPWQRLLHDRTAQQGYGARPDGRGEWGQSGGRT
jgi:hypothetical protein